MPVGLLPYIPPPWEVGCCWGCGGGGGDYFRKVDQASFVRPGVLWKPWMTLLHLIKNQVFFVKTMTWESTF